MNSNDISPAEIEHLSLLANLPLSHDDKLSLQKELTSVVAYMGEVQKIPLEGSLITAQVTGKVNELREDEVGPSLLQSEALSQSESESHNGYFVVPQVIAL